MAQTIKVPKEVMEVFYEMLALEELKDSAGFFKKQYYTSKYKKAYYLAWRALGAAHPQVNYDEWILNATAGTVTKIEAVLPKARTRKPKATPVATATSTVTKEGEVK